MNEFQVGNRVSILPGVIFGDGDGTVCAIHSDDPHPFEVKFVEGDFWLKFSANELVKGQ